MTTKTNEPETFQLDKYELFGVQHSRFDKNVSHRVPVAFFCPACNATNYFPANNPHGAAGKCDCGVCWRIYGNALMLNESPIP